jgi:hypothetical protein
MYFLDIHEHGTLKPVEVILRRREENAGGINQIWVQHMFIRKCQNKTLYYRHILIETLNEKRESTLKLRFLVSLKCLSPQDSIHPTALVLITRGGTLPVPAPCAHWLPGLKLVKYEKSHTLNSRWVRRFTEYTKNKDRKKTYTNQN